MSNPIETHSARNPRLLVFHGIVAVLLLTLAGGLAYRQLLTSSLYSERERLQNQRRIIVPGPRGNIYDRNGKLLVGNQPKFSVVLNLAERALRDEIRAEHKTIEHNYRVLEKAERPNSGQIEQIARHNIAQHYLDKVNYILGRHETVRDADLERHFNQTLLLPYVLLNDLAPEEYARLIERLPVNSPLQVYTSSTRYYPFNPAAAHTLGYVGVNNDPEVEDFPGDNLLTFKMKGSVGRSGLEMIFDDQLQGETGGAIYRVDPAGYKVGLPIDTRLPEQGRNITTSLDIDLQQAAEEAMKDRTGAVVALDVRTGEVLVLASKPDYDLYTLQPHVAADADKTVAQSGVWLNRAIQGQYPPGSTFKIITAVAGLRSGAIEPGISKSICPGFLMVGNRRFPCWNHNGHGERDVVGAIRDSCNVFFYKFGLEIGPELIAAEAHRFGYDHPTGIELPYEFSKPHVASPDLKRALFNEPWVPGDTANTAIGQGDTLVSPLQVACFVASFARGETETKPTLLHDPHRPTQHTAPIGISPSDYNTVLEGMEQCYQVGTARMAHVDGLNGAAKTGTAQKGRIELAWTIAFAPVESPQIAIAIVLEGDEDSTFGGGVHAGPVAHAVLAAWKEKHDHLSDTTVKLNMSQAEEKPRTNTGT